MPFFRRIRDLFRRRTARPEPPRPRPGEPDVDLRRTNPNSPGVARIATGRRYRIEQRDRFEGGEEVRPGEIRTGREYNIEQKDKFNVKYKKPERGRIEVE